MWHNNILEVIGNTPMVRLNRVARGVRATLLAKLEYMNPGGSVKDRIGITMLEAAEKDLKLTEADLRASLEVNDGTEEGQLERLRQYASQADIAAVGVSVTKEDKPSPLL